MGDFNRTGIILDSIAIGVTPSLHDAVQTVVIVPGSEEFRFSDASGTSKLFTTMTQLVGCDSGFVITGGAGKNVRAYSTGGRMLREVTLRAVLAPVSAELRAMQIKSIAEAMDPTGTRRVEKQLDNLTPNPVIGRQTIFSDGMAECGFARLVVLRIGVSLQSMEAMHSTCRYRWRCRQRDWTPTQQSEDIRSGRRNGR